MLLCFQLERRDPESLCVEGTVLVSDQDNALEAMDVDQESQLFCGCFFFTKRNKVSSQAGGSAGDGESVVARQLQRDFHEFIKLFAEPSITAIDCGGPDPPVVEWYVTRVVFGGCLGRVVH